MKQSNSKWFFQVSCGTEQSQMGQNRNSRKIFRSCGNNDRLVRSLEKLSRPSGTSEKYLENMCEQ